MFRGVEIEGGKGGRVGEGPGVAWRVWVSWLGVDELVVAVKPLADSNSWPHDGFQVVQGMCVWPTPTWKAWRHRVTKDGAAAVLAPLPSELWQPMSS